MRRPTLQDDCKTALLIAVTREGGAEIVDKLLRAGADANCKTKERGFSALMLANESEEITTLLLRAGADTKAADAVRQQRAAAMHELTPFWRF